MLEKEVKQYKRGNSFTYRIDLSKKDDFEGGEKIMILRLEEYNDIINEIENLKLQIQDSKNIISKLKENRSEVDSNINKIIQERNDEIASKNKEIMSLIEENKSSIQKCYDIIDEKDKLLQQSNEEIRMEREKTDDAKDKAQDAILKERLRHDGIVSSKDEELRLLNEKLSDSINMLTAYRLLIERFKSMSFIDRILNRYPDESDLKQNNAIETYAVLDSSDNKSED